MFISVCSLDISSYEFLQVWFPVRHSWVIFVEKRHLKFAKADYKRSSEMLWFIGKDGNPLSKSHPSQFKRRLINQKRKKYKLIISSDDFLKTVLFNNKWDILANPFICSIKIFIYNLVNLLETTTILHY